MRIQSTSRLVVITTAASLAACAPKPVIIAVPPPVETPKGPTPWREVARDGDAERLETIAHAWKTALENAKRARLGRAVAEEGALLDPEAALPRPLTPPGRYQCRLVRFAPTGRRPALTMFKPYFCYVEQEGDLTTLVKETGAERQAGRLWPDSDTRLIFLGTLALGEERPPAYGQRRERDLAGVLERIGEFRWRLVIPRTRGGLDVLEMMPFTEAKMGSR